MAINGTRAGGYPGLGGLRVVVTLGWRISSRFPSKH
jgi:hypothetical protein